MNSLQRCVSSAPLLFLALGCSSSSATSAEPGVDASSPSDATDSQDAAGGGDDATATTVVGVDAAACPSMPTTGDFPPDVAAVLQAKCQTCHTMPLVNHAPFPLLTYEDTLAIDTLQPFAGEPIWEVMSVVIQPGGVPHMPFGNSPALTTDEYQTLYAWLFSCAVPVPGDAGATNDAGTD